MPNCYELDIREKLEFPKLYEFFIKEKNINKVLPILYRKSKISLSLLEWFVITYSKNKKLIINNKNIYQEYKNQLNTYNKRYFDPFKREGAFFEIQYGPSKNDVIISTFCQLNFLKWAINSKIIDYLNVNIDNVIQNYKKFKKIKPIQSEKDHHCVFLIKNPVKWHQ